MKFTFFLLFLFVGSTGGAAPSSSRGLRAAPSDGDLRAARTLFERNLDAIRRRDRAAYVACYLQSGSLARSSPSGTQLGFEEFAKAAGENWPDEFEGTDLRLVAVRPGIVYGSYRYRVRYGEDEQSGLSERLFIKIGRAWRIAMTSAFPAPPGTPPPPLALVGGTLIDGTGASPVAGAVVLLRDGQIECAGRDCEIPSGVRRLDATRQWITPGLVDAHVHFSQTGWADGRPDSLDVRDRYPYEKTSADLKAHPERFFRSQLCSGVTAVFDDGGYPWTVALARGSLHDPRAPHLAVAGPLLSTIDFWLNLPAERQFIHLKDETAARTSVRYLAAIGSDAVKVWYIVSPSLSVEASEKSVLAAGDEARQRGLPLIVHATGLAEAKVALRAGAKLLVHGVQDKPIDSEFLELAKKSGAVYCPTLTVSVGSLRMFESALNRLPPRIEDPNSCIDAVTRSKFAETPKIATPDGFADRVNSRRSRVSEVLRIGRENLKRVADAGISIAMGTDAGNPLTPHGPSVYPEMEAMQEAGMSPMQVLVASTRGGSEAMNQSKRFGTVEKGKAADLLVLDADPIRDITAMRRLRYVVRGGVARSIEDLKATAAATQ